MSPSKSFRGSSTVADVVFWMRVDSVTAENVSFVAVTFWLLLLLFVAFSLLFDDDVPAFIVMLSSGSLLLSMFPSTPFMFAFLYALLKLL
jgi:hypothetical protein